MLLDYKQMSDFISKELNYSFKKYYKNDLSFYKNNIKESFDKIVNIEKGCNMEIYDCILKYKEPNIETCTIKYKKIVIYSNMWGTEETYYII